MRIIRDYQFVKSSDKGASVAVGNFDGVHIGHQHGIEIARQWGRKNKSPLGVLTFEPHPRSYFFPDGLNFRLMSSDAKATRLNKMNVEKLYELNFNKALASLTPFEFADQVISKGLGLIDGKVKKLPSSSTKKIKLKILLVITMKALPIQLKK